MNFSNKTAIITGGANGIGLCITEEFRKLGAKVGVIDINSKGCDCDLFHCGDIADERTLVAFVDKVAATFGKVDYLINNACISRKGILSGCGYDDFLYVQKVGVVAPYMLTKLLLPHFNEGAAVVNVCFGRQYVFFKARALFFHVNNSFKFNVRGHV